MSAYSFWSPVQPQQSAQLEHRALQMNHHRKQLVLSRLSFFFPYSSKIILRKCRLYGFPGLFECPIPGSIILTLPGCRMVVQPFRLYCSPPSALTHKTCPLWMWLVRTKLFMHRISHLPKVKWQPRVVFIISGTQ